MELKEQSSAPTLAHKLGDVPHVSGLLRRIARLSGAGERVAEWLLKVAITREANHYQRDFDPNLASIRNEPEFKAVFADMARDMARQRAALAARPKDAPLELMDAAR